MKAYELYVYEAYEPEQCLGYYKQRENAEKEQLRLMNIQDKYSRRITKYESLSAHIQEKTNYPKIPTELYHGDIEEREITISEGMTQIREDVRQKPKLDLSAEIKSLVGKFDTEINKHKLAEIFQKIQDHINQIK